MPGAGPPPLITHSMGASRSGKRRPTMPEDLASLIRVSSDSPLAVALTRSEGGALAVGTVGPGLISAVGAAVPPVHAPNTTKASAASTFIVATMVSRGPHVGEGRDLFHAPAELRRDPHRALERAVSDR